MDSLEILNDKTQTNRQHYPTNFLCLSRQFAFLPFGKIISHLLSLQTCSPLLTHSGWSHFLFHWKIRTIRREKVSFNRKFISLNTLVPLSSAFTPGKWDNLSQFLSNAWVLDLISYKLRKDSGLEILPFTSASSVSPFLFGHFHQWEDMVEYLSLGKNSSFILPGQEE